MKLELLDFLRKLSHTETARISMKAAKRAMTMISHSSTAPYLFVRVCFSSDAIVVHRYLYDVCVYNFFFVTDVCVCVPA